MNWNLESIASSATSTNPVAQSFALRFFDHLKAWLADASNGIENFFAKKVHTQELCVADDSGAETCITKAQLDALLSGVAGAGNTVPPPAKLPVDPIISDPAASSTPSVIVDPATDIP